ncbi:MAG: Na+/H+ antiporter NhaC family protein, partial [Treponemataceae bacterium]
AAAMSAISLRDACVDTDASGALMYTIIFTIAITYTYYLARRLMTLKVASESLRDGIKSMVPALIILSMAWTIGAIIKSSPEDGGLGLGKYLSQLVIGGGFSLHFIPAIVFALSALIAFATGTSWGTFSIMIPIVMPIAIGLGQDGNYDSAQIANIAMICIAAVTGGAVFGDHASPISDTTILSSTGASCPHLEHVATQMPYAIFVAVCTFVGFITAGFFMNAVISWIATLIVFGIGIIFLPKVFRAKL